MYVAFYVVSIAIFISFNFIIYIAIILVFQMQIFSYIIFVQNLQFFPFPLVWCFMQDMFLNNLWN